MKDRMKLSLPPKVEKWKTGWNSVYHQKWKNERQDETQFTTKIDGFLSFNPPLNANVLFCRFFFLNLTLCMTKLRVLVLCFSYFFAGFFLNLTLCMTKLRVLVLCFSYFMHNSNVIKKFVYFGKRFEEPIILNTIVHGQLQHMLIS